MADNVAPTISNPTVEIINKTDTTITARWSPATSANNFYYFVSIMEGRIKPGKWSYSYATIASVTVMGVTQHQFKNLKPAKRYKIKVYAIDSAASSASQYDPVITNTEPSAAQTGTSASSAPQASTTPAPDKEAPTTSNLNLTVTDVTQNTITLRWTPATDNVTKDSKIIYRLTKIERVRNVLTLKYSDRKSVIYSGPNYIGFKVPNLSPGTQYSFEVAAIDEAGNELTYNRLTAYTTGLNTQTTQTSQTTQSSPIATTDFAPPKTESERRSQIRQFFSEIRKGDNLCNAIVSSVDPNLKEYIISGNQAFMLTNETHSIDNDRTKFMPIDESGIYPGRLVYVNRHLIDGKIDDVQFYFVKDDKKQTGNVTVNVNFLAGISESLSEEKVEATFGKVKDSIGRILNKALKAEALPPGDAESDIKMSSSQSKIAVDLGCSVEYLGAKCKVDTSTSKSQESFYQIENFTQGFYQVSVDAEDRDSVNFLGEGVTAQDLKKAYEDGPIGIIKSVTYGRVGYNVKRYDASSFTFKGDESVSYGTTASVTSKQDIQKNSKSAYHYAKVWGGSASTAGAALKSGWTAKNDAESNQIDAAFSEAMAENMEISMKNQGVPISFTVVYLASGNGALTKMTGEYVETSYTPLYNRISLYLNNQATTLSGTESVQILIYPRFIQLNSEGKIIKEDWYGEFKYNFNCKKDLHDTITLPPNCYFKDNQVYIILRTKVSAGASWRRADAGYVGLKPGYLGIKILGNYLKNQLHPGGDSGYCHYV